MAVSQEDTPQVCTHERRPGTTVCLRCRHDARVAAQARRRRLAMRASAVGAAAITIVIALQAGASALRASAAQGAASASASTTQQASVSDSQSVTVAVASNPPAPRDAQTAQVPPAASGQPGSAPVEQQGEVVRRARASVAPIVPLGDSKLSDSILVTRADSGVTVSFDTPMQRTRRPDKFERFVRATLPRIYGGAADSALARMPDGSLASQGDLLTVLPSRGVRVPLTGGGALVLYPETRQGQDGPLVVRYRVSVVGASF